MRGKLRVGEEFGVVQDGSAGGLKDLGLEACANALFGVWIRGMGMWVGGEFRGAGLIGHMGLGYWALCGRSQQRIRCVGLLRVVGVPQGVACK